MKLVALAGLLQETTKGVERALSLSIVAIGEGEHADTVGEVVEDNDIAVHDIVYVWGIVALHRGVGHIDVLKISHGIERGKTIQSVVAASLAFDTETSHKPGHRLRHLLLGLALVVEVELLMGLAAVGIGGLYAAVRHAKMCHRAHADKRACCIVAVVVATLHECRLGIQVAQAQVHTYGRIEVGKNGARRYLIVKGIHTEKLLRIRSYRIPWPYPCG